MNNPIPRRHRFAAKVVAISLAAGMSFQAGTVTINTIWPNQYVIKLQPTSVETRAAADETVPPPGNGGRAMISCDFCGKDQHQVEGMIAADRPTNGGNVAICDQCANAEVELVEKERE